jgi:hypothetical protein
MYLYNLQEKRQVQRLNIQKNVIVWMYPPLVDLLAPGDRSREFTPRSPATECQGHKSYAYRRYSEGAHQTGTSDTCRQGTMASGHTIHGCNSGYTSLDGTTVPFPVSTSELEAPAVMPEGINLLLLASTKNKCQLLLDLTMELIQELVELD